MPLTAEEMAIVLSTVPILEVGGETLIKHFYSIMLRDYPVVIPFFNAKHQASGDQPRALAHAVLMYARNIEKLEGLGPLVNQIVSKHVSLNINPDHYSVVGTCLLQAIREVLGPEVATDTVITAWASAYGQLAAILSSAEKNIYEANAAAIGGWKDEREFIVTRKIPECSLITSFYLEAADGKPIMPYAAGKFIGMHIVIDDEEVRRNYSLSSVSNAAYYRISVKKEPGGRVSTYLHDQVQLGHRLNLYPPAGDFTLPQERKQTPLAFIVGGVGITPALAMLEEALKDEITGSRPITFIHTVKSQEVQAFHTYMQELASQYCNLKYHSVYTQHNSDDVQATSSHLNVDKLRELIPSGHINDVDAFFLGPKSFMIDVKKSLLEIGLTEKQLHWEFFGPSMIIDS